MPELPEVETVARGLQREITGRRILSVTLRKTDFIDNPSEVERQLPGRRIVSIERYGKFLLLRLSPAENEGQYEGESALLVHLGMTGMLMPRPVAEPHAKHTHVVLSLDDGRELRYVDSRRFGRIAYLGSTPLRDELRRFGADPLEAKIEEFCRRIGERQTRIKALLLDQRVLRGVGNIYADESLWHARIHPAKTGKSIERTKVHGLYHALQDVLRKAILLRGSSISDFLDADGQPGEYQQHHKVYGREGQACYRCHATIRRGIVAGRSSFYCPKCQKPPRGWSTSGTGAKVRKRLRKGKSR